MPKVKLLPHQEEALTKMHNGCILCGGVGSGKSITSIAYYFTKAGGKLEPFTPPETMKPLYIITTARKRDTYEWDDELRRYGLVRGENTGLYCPNVYIDSWNNITNYVDIKDSYIIFDEQRLVGTGVWVKTFLKMVKNNEWILLSATPGDTWLDYAPVFIANGFYKNFTEFRYEHVVYAPFLNFRRVDRYVNIKRLERLRDRILVDMPFERKTEQHHIDIVVEYDKETYMHIMKTRFNNETKEPIKNASELCSLLRKVCNSSPAKINALLDIYDQRPRVIVFYNYDYELEILKDLCEACGFTYAEWNGHKHQPIPDTTNWMYLVQYTAGAEGWNCIKTDTIVFYSQNYSYKIMTQSAGRIDRMNTTYTDLYYYHIKTRSPIDKGIDRAITNKKKFNESKFYTRVTPPKDDVITLRCA